MAIAREIQVAIGAEGGEHLVARGVDGGTCVLYVAHFCAAC